MKSFLFAIVAFVLCSTLVYAQSLSPKEIIKKIDDTERITSSKGSTRQIITTSSGQKRTLEMDYWSRDRNDKQLMLYTAPKRVEGDKILMLDEGNDIWFYTPKTDRVRHLASHARKQKVQGSDFSYEDMASGEIEKDYTYKLLGEEKVSDRDCYQFELIPTPSGPSYQKLILWADKEKFLTLRIDYYEADDILKRLTMSDIRNIDGHWTAMNMTMKNLQDGGETVMETIEIQFDIDIPDEIFTTRNLKKR
ncbi:MAG: outer membrane lipoprotein-sorting protein [Deferribacteres bacterium]|nr:outer membrane lipoprotein-sorting protein [candidate division KSB1 bacterium]MCB9503934.1 outer membrane lipoprotein-sorting protein [Deferribacteres bacterium]